MLQLVGAIANYVVEAFARRFHAAVASGELAGQMKLVAGPGGIVKGSLIPFVVGELCLESELDGSTSRSAYACDLVYSRGAEAQCSATTSVGSGIVLHYFLPNVGEPDVFL